MIRQCEKGHASLDAANWKCPWCLLERCAEVNDQMAYIAGIVERGEGKPIDGNDTIPQAVLRYIKTLEAKLAEAQQTIREVCDRTGLFLVRSR